MRIRHMRNDSLRKITLPPNESIDVNNGIVIVGANGSGKTRFGAWIESNSPEKNLVLRVLAQKSLTFPDNIRSMDLDKSCNLLHSGHQDITPDKYAEGKKSHKYGGQPITALQNDYEALLTHLFSEENEVSSQYRNDSKLSGEKKVPVPTTKLDKIKAIWEKILPHRTLIIGKGTITIQSSANNPRSYKASEMSDGERVIFYLIGQCLCAPVSGIIVIDEPELHLHKSILYALWNKIERERSDCLFVYLTHDIDFAISRNGFKKINLESFDGENWTWSFIKESEGVPENLDLEIRGSRNKVLLVEGINGSIDVQFYQNIFEDFLVKPCAGCSNVINYTKALRANSDFHHQDIYGLIDRDRRSDEEIRALEEDKIYTLKVAEVENLLITPEILEIVSKHLKFDPVEKRKAVEKFVFDELSKELENQKQLHVIDEIRHRLSHTCLDKIEGIPLPDFIKKTVDDGDIRNKIKEKFNNIVKTKNYIDLLCFYNRKTIASSVGCVFGLKNRELPELVLRLSRDKTFMEELRTSVLKYLPAEFLILSKMRVTKHGD